MTQQMFFLSIAVASLLASIFFIAKYRHQACLWSILVLAIALRFYAASDAFLHAWDEQFHALVAKNLLENPLKPTLYKTPLLNHSQTDWSNNHVWVHKPPLTLWLMAVSLKTFGVSPLAARLPSILLSSIGVWLIFLLGRKMFNAKVALVASFFAAIHGLNVELSSGRTATDHVDALFMFFVLVAFTWMYLRKEHFSFLNNLVFAVFVGAAIMVKWLPALLLVGLWGMLHFSKIKKLPFYLNLLLILAVIAAIVLPWQWFIFKNYPVEAAYEASFNWKHFTEVLENNGGPWYFFFAQIPRQYGELIVIPFLYIAYIAIRRTVKLRFQDNFVLLFVWILIPTLFFSIPLTKMKAYTHFAAPAFFLITAFSVVYLFSIRKWPSYLLAILLILLPIRYAFERLKIANHSQNKAIEAAFYGNFLKPFSNDKVVLINAKYPISGMFCCDIAAAYDYHPEQSELVRLEEMGYKIVDELQLRQSFYEQNINSSLK